uniref:Uncharacterized protein n=1 Tax=Arundo donax TaxID=35708 RepID=A0A0A8ZWN5_ARUDO
MLANLVLRRVTVIGSRGRRRGGTIKSCTEISDRRGNLCN